MPITVNGSTVSVVRLYPGSAGSGGSVATDSLWDAAGDLAVGTGANTAARLAMGTALQVLRVNAGATGLEYATLAGGGNAQTADPLSQFAATTSAQLRGVLSDETGGGLAVFNDTPTLIAPVLGTPTSGTLTNCTGLPIASGVSGMGTGVATALAVNVGSAGAFVTFNGAGGTPSSLTLTNASGLPVSGITSSTSTALGVGSIELGHATDTTIARSSAGVVTVEGKTVALVSVANTWSAIQTHSADVRVLTGSNFAMQCEDLTSYLLHTAVGSPGASYTISWTASSNATITLGGSLTISSAATVSGTNTGDQTSVTGNAGTATKLETARTINGVSFDGTANITVTAAGSTLSDTVPVTLGGTGRTTSTTAYGLIAAGTTATGAHQTLAAGTTSQILVGGGASALPVWTAATGSGAPMRAVSPAMTGTATAEAMTLTGLFTSSGADFNVTISNGTITGNSITIGTSGVANVGTIELGHSSDTTLARSSAGNVSIEGNVIYRAGGTDVSVADGGTGISSGTSGGVPYFSGSTTIASSGALAANALVIGGGAGAAPSTTTTGTGTLTALGIAQGTAGSFATTGRSMIPIMAAGMSPSATGGCAALATIASAANQPDIQTLDFDSSTQEYAQFSIPMPESWDEGTVTFVPIWSHASTTTNFGVVWDLQAVAVSNDDGIAVAFGTAQTSADTGGTTNDVYVGPESSAITIAGSPAAGDTVFFRLSRVTGNGSDTMAIDARLHGIRLYFTTNSGVDS